MNYLRVLSGSSTTPLFATFILGMFWKKMTPAAGWIGLVSGTGTAIVVAILSEDALGGWSIGVIGLAGQGASFVAAGAAFVVNIAVSIVVSLVTQPKAESELRGLVYSSSPRRQTHDENEGTLAWWQRPTKLAGVSLAMVIVLIFSSW